MALTLMDLFSRLSADCLRPVSVSEIFFLQDSDLGFPIRPVLIFERVSAVTGYSLCLRNAAMRNTSRVSPETLRPVRVLAIFLRASFVTTLFAGVISVISSYRFSSPCPFFFWLNTPQRKLITKHRCAHLLTCFWCRIILPFIPICRISQTMPYLTQRLDVALLNEANKFTRCTGR